MSKLSFFLTDEIEKVLNVSQNLALLLSEHIKSELDMDDDYFHAAFSAVDAINRAHNGWLIESEIGGDPDVLDTFRNKLASITHSWVNYGRDPVQRQIAFSLAEYINVFHCGSQKAFANAQEIQPAQVTQWLKKDFIVVNKVLYSKRRKLHL